LQTGTLKGWLGPKRGRKPPKAKKMEKGEQGKGTRGKGSGGLGVSSGRKAEGRWLSPREKGE